MAPLLPQLRRFARALTGTQAAGDAYAVATLEAIVAGPGVLADDIDLRAALFRVFLKIWTSVPINHEAGRESDDTTTEMPTRHLGAMTPLPRVAFLLHAVEGFDRDQIATILDRPVAEIQALIERAGREIAAEISTDVLIIEDEQLIAIDLEALVEDLGHRVTRIARTHAEAVAAIAEKAPGLVLADIQLADGSSGLEAVNEILLHVQVPVIFITAFPERLLTGQRPEPAFLITKPFQPDTVKAIISQALFFGQNARIPNKASPAA
ncbi:response regulator [Limobrevibacterium gyesilva]